MSTDKKCFFGLHKYETLEKLDVTDINGVGKVGISYVLRCTNCGKIRSVFVPTNCDLLDKYVR